MERINDHLLGKPLTKRELDTAVLLAFGSSNDEIARSMKIKVRTVKEHLTKCYAKYGVRNRVELAGKLKLMRII